MRIIKSSKEIEHNYFGVDMYKYQSGEYFAKIKDIFIRPRNDETTQIYPIFEIIFSNGIQLKSQMFYMSSNAESRFFQFFYNLGLYRDHHEGYAFDDIIGQLGIITIENEIIRGNEFSNVVSFMPMKREEWIKEWKSAYGIEEKEENSDEAN